MGQAAGLSNGVKETFGPTHAQLSSHKRAIFSENDNAVSILVNNVNHPSAIRSDARREI
jgi:hypothetical protein